MINRVLCRHDHLTGKHGMLEGSCDHCTAATIYGQQEHVGRTLSCRVTDAEHQHRVFAFCSRCATRLQVRGQGGRPVQQAYGRLTYRSDHFWHDDHVTEVCLDCCRLLALIESLLGLSEPLEEPEWLASDTPHELSSSTAVHQVNKLKKGGERGGRWGDQS